MTRPALAASFVAVLVCSLCHAGGPPKAKFAELEGTWVIASIEIADKSLLEKGENWKIVIKDGKANFAKNDPAMEPVLLAKVLDASKKPKRVTFAYEGKLAFYGIYEVKGDELRVCGDGVDTATEKNPEARRPKKIDSQSGLLLVFKRVKEKR
jgi:uncharacterized protein (TIGR03067 family)